jgi:osmotically-inducible protein OsmY
VRDRDRDTNTGTSELKAVASEAMQLGKRYVQGMGAWLATRSSEMRNQQGGDPPQDQGNRGWDEEDDKRSLRQQEGWQEDYQQQAQRGFSAGGERDAGGDAPGWNGGSRGSGETRGPHGAPEQRYGDRQRYQYAGGNRGDDADYRTYRHGAMHADETRSGQTGRSGEMRGESEYPEAAGYGAQASDKQGRQYRGQYGAPGYGQGQGGQWRSEYGGQPETRYGGTGGHRGSEQVGGNDEGRGAYSNHFGEHQSTGRPGGHRGRGPKGYSRSDARILEDINEKLFDDDHVDASEITVEVRQGIVALSGTVEHRSMKYHVEDLAERCSGVKDVDNQLRVRRSQGSDRAGQGPTTGATSAAAGPSGTDASDAQAGFSPPTIPPLSKASGAPGGDDSEAGGNEDASDASLDGGPGAKEPRDP